VSAVAVAVIVLTGLVLLYVFARLAYRLRRGDADEPAGRDSDSFRR
jgi:hypothetical protein